MQYSFLCWEILKNDTLARGVLPLTLRKHTCCTRIAMLCIMMVVVLISSAGTTIECSNEASVSRIAPRISHGIADTSYEVTVEIDRAEIIEDRDFLSAEIYLKARIDGGSYQYTSIYNNINDGDTIQLDWIILDEDVRDSFEIRVEIWESDDDYNEAQNDFLGYVQYTRDPVFSTSGWHNAQGSIGGNNDLQAKVYIRETVVEIVDSTSTSTTPEATDTSTSPVVTEGGQDNPLAITYAQLQILAFVGLIALVLIGAFVARSRGISLTSITEAFPSSPQRVPQKDGAGGSNTRASSAPIMIVCPFCGSKTRQGLAKCESCGAEI